MEGRLDGVVCEQRLLPAGKRGLVAHGLLRGRCLGGRTLSTLLLLQPEQVFVCGYGKRVVVCCG